jgi:hypothetical protein
MDRELQVYYETLIDLFSSEGWKTFILDQESAFEHLVFSASRDCLDNDSWQYRRGKMDTLSQIINFEEMIRNSYETLEKESVIDAEWTEVVH